MNARYWYRYGKYLDLTLPDNHRIYCGLFKMAFDSERALMLGMISLPFASLFKHYWIPINN